MASTPLPSSLPSLTYEDDNGQTFTYSSAEPLDDGRRGIYAALDPSPFGADKSVFSVTTTGAGAAENTRKEFLVALAADGSGTPSFVVKACTVSCEEVPHSEMVEYRFEAPCDEWKLAPVTQDSLQG